MKLRQLLPIFYCGLILGFVLSGCGSSGDPDIPEKNSTCTPVCGSGFTCDNGKCISVIPPIIPGDKPMARIPAGYFEMGDAFDEGDSDELPSHTVWISAFSLDIHEVTNTEYAACIDAAGCTPPLLLGSRTRTAYFDNPAYYNYPVIWVNWNQAKEYCTWAGKRLPTEAEWEYAARGGLAGKRYPWGDTINGSNANYWESGDPEDNDTTAVGSYPANEYGLHDIAGNVSEWVHDRYQSNYYSVSPQHDPTGPQNDNYRVLRGGACNNNTPSLRVAHRVNRHPEVESYTVGFRCAW